MAYTISLCPSCSKLNRVNLETAAEKQPVCGHCQTSLKLEHGVNEVNGRELGALIQKSPLPVVVDFWAPWCGPCRVFAPTFSQAAEHMAGQVVFAKMNTEADPGGSQPYGVRGIPTLIVFQSGVEAARQSGAMPLTQFLAWLDGHIRHAGVA